MRKIELLILVGLASLQFSPYVIAQKHPRPEVKGRERGTTPADKSAKWNRERPEDKKRAPESESAEKKSTTRDERAGGRPGTRDKVSAWDRRQQRESGPTDGKTGESRSPYDDKRSADARGIDKSSRWNQRLEKGSESKSSQRQDLLDHVFHGDVKKGKARGFHYEGAEMEATYGTKVIEGTRTAPDSHGVYEAKVTVRGVTKAERSSFFPRSWSRADVVRTINEANANRAAVAGRAPNYFEGRSSSGVAVGLYCNKNGTVVTAFPLYGKY